ncbi:MAG: RtcB family protein [Promethearchaeota archaeon]
MKDLVKIAKNIYEIPKHEKLIRVNGKITTFKMRVPARIYASEILLERIKKDKTIDQLTNIATLPGIQKFAIGLSDSHQGYGFNIGGVAATLADTGAISPGGVGYDINCGVRLLRTDLTIDDVKPKIKLILNELFRNVPSGVGSSGKIANLTINDLNSVLEDGVNWAIEKGYGYEEDIQNCEENGRLPADANVVSSKAKSRGKSQIGSLGSGNHFLEVQKVAEIYDPRAAKVMGIESVGQVTVMIHTGSRGLGHQVCSDYLRLMERAIRQYKYILPDRELVYVTGEKPEATRYLKAMGAAANFAWNNRQMIMHWVRESFSKVFHKSPDVLGMDLIYDVCHNILKREEHELKGKKVLLNVHRKGATRSFPPNHPKVPKKYKSIGQPVLIPGSMGTSSYVCVGQPKAMELTFGSTAHGAGRELSRSAAIRRYWGRTVQKELRDQGIEVKAATDKVIAEEAPGAYKSIEEVVQVTHDLGIVKKVVKLVPIGVTKG